MSVLTITDRIRMARRVISGGYADHLVTYYKIIQRLLAHGYEYGCTCHNPCDKWDWFGEYIEYKMLHPDNRVTYGQFRLSMVNATGGTPPGDKCRAKIRTMEKKELGANG